MGHSQAQWEDRIRARLGDLGVLQLLAPEQIPLAIEDALLTLGRDLPRIATQTFAGDGLVYTFDLTDAIVDPIWATGWSRLLEVEWPAGQRIPELIETRFMTERDGTVTLHSAIPGTGQNIRFRYTALYPHPNDVAGALSADRVPDIYFPAVTALASAIMARNKAAEMARRQSNSVAGDLHTLDPTQLFEAARLLEKVYTDLVLGRPAEAGAAVGAAVGLAVHDVDVFPYSLFHQRHN